jgi:hypothetical protein
MDFLCEIDDVFDAPYDDLIRIEQIRRAKEYRQTVAIPRWLYKRGRRDYTPKSIHPSRKRAAEKKERNNGRFAKSKKI